MALYLTGVPLAECAEQSFDRLEGRLDQMELSPWAVLSGRLGRARAAEGAITKRKVRVLPGGSMDSESAFYRGLLGLVPPDLIPRQAARGGMVARARTSLPGGCPLKTRMSLELPGRSDLATAPWPRDIGRLSARPLACFLPCVPCPGSLQGQAQTTRGGSPRARVTKQEPWPWGTSISSPTYPGAMGAARSLPRRRSKARSGRAGGSPRRIRRSGPAGRASAPAGARSRPASGGPAPCRSGSR
jgi:hypothetical protein